MGEHEITTDDGQREEREVAEKIERKLAPIRDLIENEMLKSYSYSVTVEWSEPPETGAQEWTKHDAAGPLDESFLRWATGHYEYWCRHGDLHDVVSLRIVKIENNDDNQGRRSW